MKRAVSAGDQSEPVDSVFAAEYFKYVDDGRRTKRCDRVGFRPRSGGAFISSALVARTASEQNRRADLSLVKTRRRRFNGA